nr:recombinase RecT [uncultured Agathobaculum sp.]
MNNSNQAIQKPKFSVAITTKGYKNLINNTLGDPERSKRFVASITSAVAVNPALQDCDAGTILAGALLGESLNLSPSPQLGQYYLVPFECAVKGPDGKKIYLFDDNGNHLTDANGRWLFESEKRAQFVLGYKGYIQLALRTGQYADLDVMEIKDGEYLGKDSITGKPRFNFVEDDDERDALPVIGYMAYFEYLNGFRKVLYWSRKKMMSHADKYSPAFSAAAYERIQNGEIPDKDMWKYSSFWYKDFNEMAKKTMLRQLISRWGVMTTEMQRAITQDSNFAAIGAANEIDLTPEDQQPVMTPMDQQPSIRPEATTVVENVDLADL